MLDIKDEKFSLPDRIRRSGPAPQTLLIRACGMLVTMIMVLLPPFKVDPAMIHVIDACENGHYDVATAGFERHLVYPPDFAHLWYHVLCDALSLPLSSWACRYKHHNPLSPRYDPVSRSESVGEQLSWNQLRAQVLMASYNTPAKSNLVGREDPKRYQLLTWIFVKEHARRPPHPKKRMSMLSQQIEKFPLYASWRIHLWLTREASELMMVYPARRAQKRDVDKDKGLSVLWTPSWLSRWQGEIWAPNFLPTLLLHYVFFSIWSNCAIVVGKLPLSLP